MMAKLERQEAIGSADYVPNTMEMAKPSSNDMKTNKSEPIIDRHRAYSGIETKLYKLEIPIEKRPRTRAEFLQLGTINWVEIRDYFLDQSRTRSKSAVNFNLEPILHEEDTYTQENLDERFDKLGPERQFSTSSFIVQVTPKPRTESRIVASPKTKLEFILGLPIEDVESLIRSYDVFGILEADDLVTARNEETGEEIQIEVAELKQIIEENARRPSTTNSLDVQAHLNQISSSPLPQPILAQLEVPDQSKKGGKVSLANGKKKKKSSVSTVSHITVESVSQRTNTTNISINELNEEIEENKTNRNKRKKVFMWIIAIVLSLVIIGLIVGLSVGLTR